MWSDQVEMIQGGVDEYAMLNERIGFLSQVLALVHWTKEPSRFHDKIDWDCKRICNQLWDDIYHSHSKVRTQYCHQVVLLCQAHTKCVFHT